MDRNITRLAQQLLGLLLQRKWTIATAESCTAGAVSAAIASVDGASACHLGGVVCYATRLKEQLLGVRNEIIGQNGVVSEETVRAMNSGVRQITGASMALSTTGYIGSSGGDEFAENGTVWICAGCEEETLSCVLHLEGTRLQNRDQVVLELLSLAIELLVRKGTFIPDEMLVGQKRNILS